MNRLDEKKSTLSPTEINSENDNKDKTQTVTNELKARNQVKSRNIFDVIDGVTASYVLGYN